VPPNLALDIYFLDPEAVRDKGRVGRCTVKELPAEIE